MRRLALLLAFTLGAAVIFLGTFFALTNRTRSTSEFRTVADCPAGHVWLKRMACASGHWCSGEPVEALFLEWDGDTITFGSATEQRTGSVELKRRLFRRLEAIDDPPPNLATIFGGRPLFASYSVEARCRGATAFANAYGDELVLFDRLRASSPPQWPRLVHTKFTSTAWHSRRALALLHAELEAP